MVGGGPARGTARSNAPNFELGEASKPDAETKTALSLKAVSLRGRRLEGAVLVDAHLRKADFTGAQLARANFLRADLREAKFECNQGHKRRCAQLQGASLNFAQLQGASLDGAQLQGAELDGAQLQGASLVGAQLQGISLYGTQLRDASLDNVFVWRTNPPARENLHGALIKAPIIEPKYGGLDCPFLSVCDWGDASYAALKASIETAPQGPPRDEALKWIARLGERPYEEDPGSAKAWRDLAAESELSGKAYPDELARQLIEIGCGADGAPSVISGLVAQVYLRFRVNSAEAAEVARGFLDDANCPGVYGLSEDNKTRLRQIRRQGSPQSDSGTTSR